VGAACAVLLSFVDPATPDLTAALRMALRSEDHVCPALDALERIGARDDATVRAVLRVVRERSSAVASAVRLLGRLEMLPEECVPELMHLLQPSQPEATRAAAAEALAHFRTHAAQIVPALVAAVHEEFRLRPYGGSGVAVTGRGRDWAALALAQLGAAAAPAVPDLVTALGHEDSECRYAVVIALGSVGAEAAAAVPALAAILEDGAPGLRDVRHHAVVALGNIGPAAAPAVPGLVPLLADETLREVVIVTLGQIGPAAETAGPALLALRRFPALAGKLDEALRRIGVTPSPRVPD
jgi:HEAT repeat protein